MAIDRMIELGFSLHTEDEIETLRQVLQARIRHANELKHKLGLTPWTELQNDIYAGWRSVRDSNA